MDKLQWPLIFRLFAVGNIALGSWMLWDPVHWYHNLPANIPATGPVNEHFIRDVGCTFFVMGAVALAAANKPVLRLPAMAGIAAWYAAHAGVHVFDTMRGLLPPSQWLTDLPAIYVPSALLLWVCVALRRVHPE